MSSLVIDPNKVRDISSDFLDASGSLKIVPAQNYALTTREERAILGLKNAVYGFITTELVSYLQDFIGDRSAIEIGAGHGMLAKAIGIRATDNRMQEWADVRAYYQALRQPVVRYGDNVENLDAIDAIKKYRPQVVIASWVTHKYDPSRHEAGGNEYGVREEDVIANCDAYVFIGNERVHANKSIWALPHVKLTPPWLFSRAHNGSPEFIAIWERDKKLAQQKQKREF